MLRMTTWYKHCGIERKWPLRLVVDSVAHLAFIEMPFFFWDGDIFKSPPLIYLTLEVLCVDYIKCLPLNLQLLTWLQYYTFKDEATFNKHILWPFRLLQGLTKVTPFNLVRAFWLRDLFLFPRTYWRALLKSLLLCLVRKGIKCFFPPSTTVGDKS